MSKSKQSGGSCSSNLVTKNANEASIPDIFSMLGLPKMDGGSVTKNTQMKNKKKSTKKNNKRRRNHTKKNSRK